LYIPLFCLPLFPWLSLAALSLPFRTHLSLHPNAFFSQASWSARPTPPILILSLQGHLLVSDSYLAQLH
jgi:hypothetical protein